jgi:hypothetical protein
MMPLLLSFYLALTVTAQTPPPPHPLAGEWIGTIDTTGSESQLMVKIGNANGDWSVAARRNGGEVLSATNVKVETDKVAFSLQWTSRVDFRGTLKDGVLSGEFVTDQSSGRWAVTPKRD